MRFKYMVLFDLEASQLGMSLANLAERALDEDLLRKSFADAFRTNATGTLTKRRGALMRFFSRAMRTNIESPFMASEQDIYAFLQTFRHGCGGPTSATHFIQALRFLHSIVVFRHMPLEDVISARVRGAARDMYLEKEPLQQKEQLTLPMVRALEEFCCKASDFESVVCGQLLFCVHSAARWSDAQHIKKLEVQRSEKEILLIADGLTSKTTLSQEAKTRFLPYMAIGSGVKFPWGDAWLSARENLGLTFGTFALPSWSESAGKWASTKMSAAEASGWLREFLLKSGFDESESFARSSHSCKATLTTWTSRCPVVRFSASTLSRRTRAR